MDSSLKTKFSSAGLSEAYTILETNGIDSIEISEDLIQLTPEKFEEWFPIFGLQLKIKRLCRDGLAALKSNPSTRQSVPTSNAPNIIIGPAPQQVQENQSNGEAATVSLENGQQALDPQNPNPGDPKKKQYRSDKPEVRNFDLSALLEASGRALLKIYKYKRKFDTRQESKLCGLIVNHFLDTLPNTLLNNQDLQYISWLITVKFDKEIIGNWHVSAKIHPIPETSS